MSIEFGRIAEDYACHRAGFPPSLFERLSTLGIGLRGQDVVDVGTGAGTVARSFALRGCRVVGIDPAPALIEQARRLDAEAGVRVDYQIATAEATSLARACCDVVSAGQCWHWLDRSSAAAEARRLLRPAGAIVICYFDWLPLPDNVVAATLSLILRHNPE
ncbi:MAG: class I SAM-dependent methyltransferase [Acidimicrobiales bacterium]|jgi:2-polyprenyl-3-methyl-5-hydroxy-6-metoxy-1,4-benzoquinol methylase